MEKEITMTEKYNVKQENQLVRELLDRKNLDVFKLMTLKNSLKLADQSMSSRETSKLISKIERLILKERKKK
jgi:hypothetical protein